MIWTKLNKEWKKWKDILALKEYKIYNISKRMKLKNLIKNV